MIFSIRLTDSAIDDLDYFRKNECRIISDGIALFLTHDANVETRRRKPFAAESACTLGIADRRLSGVLCY